MLLSARSYQRCLPPPRSPVRWPRALRNLLESKGKKTTMRTLLLTGLVIAAASSAAGAADAKVGQVVYDKHCKGCHGPNGAAPANVTKLENGRVPDLRGSRVQSLSDPDLAKIVTHGKGKMRGDTTVTGRDLDDLVAFIRELKV